MKVPLALPECGEEEIQEVVEVIKSGWLTTASRTLRFEREFAEYTGAEYCLALNSGTAGLHLGLEALGIGHGDKVLVPDHTFTATADVVRYLGADPVFVDCDRETFCITVELMERAMGKGDAVKAVIPVHLGGAPCDMDGIMDLAGAHGIKVMEDAAHAIPTRYKGRLIGTFGDVTCFSFYANKTITTGEGGMIATDDKELAGRVRVMRLHGIDRDVWSRFSDTGADWAYDVVAPGFKYNMPDIAAALGIHQLRKAERFRDSRQMIAEAYYRELSGIPGLILPRIRCDIEEHSWHLFVVLIEASDTVNGVDRDAFILKMKERNIGTGVHYIPLHRMTYYRDRYGLSPDMFPNSEWVFQRCVSLPIYSAMSNDQLEYVVDSIKIIIGVK